MDPVIVFVFRVFALMIAIFCFSAVTVIILSYLIPFIKIHTNKKVRLFRKFVKGKDVEEVNYGIYNIEDGLGNTFGFEKTQRYFFKHDAYKRHIDRVYFDDYAKQDYVLKLVEKEAQKTKLRKEKNILNNLVKTSGQGD